MPPALTIIVPSCRRGLGIRACVDTLRRDFGPEVELLVVLNGADSLAENSLHELARCDPCLRWLVFRRRLGKGRALQVGLRAATGEVVGFIDDDLPFPLERLREATQHLEAREFDGFICSKWLGVSFESVEQPLLRKVFGRVFNLGVRYVFGLTYSDTQGGAKFLKREALLEVLGHPALCSGFCYDLELLLRLREHGRTLGELPLQARNTDNSTVGLLRQLVPVCREFGTLWMAWGRFSPFRPSFRGGTYPHAWRGEPGQDPRARHASGSDPASPCAPVDRLRSRNPAGRP